ncbi:hypothetical protein [Agarivorans gilvus]|uniref:Uncharacterized protein n=1 Tax=Agarivorans gilvus TaxID=680279 RepID=A0ABQ1I2A7_9ALTE|nr:hypothetical protein [Agarivorans gilvus]GGB05451.1 hypothetical protein GCM10007414_18480 [Agarivorans gilvus]
METKFPRLSTYLRVISLQPNMLEKLEEHKAFTINLAMSVQRFMEEQDATMGHFITAISHAYVGRGQKGYFKLTDGHKHYQFIFCVYQQELEDCAEKMLSVYITFESEDQEFGTLDMILQLNGDQLPLYDDADSVELAQTQL